MKLCGIAFALVFSTVFSTLCIIYEQKCCLQKYFINLQFDDKWRGCKFMEPCKFPLASWDLYLYNHKQYETTICKYKQPVDYANDKS